MASIKDLFSLSESKLDVLEVSADAIEQGGIVSNDLRQAITKIPSLKEMSLHERKDVFRILFTGFHDGWTKVPPELQRDVIDMLSDVCVDLAARDLTKKRENFPALFGSQMKRVTPYAALGFKMQVEFFIKNIKKNDAALSIYGSVAMQAQMCHFRQLSKKLKKLALAHRAEEWNDYEDGEINEYVAQAFFPGAVSIYRDRVEHVEELGDFQWTKRGNQLIVEDEYADEEDRYDINTQEQVFTED